MNYQGNAALTPDPEATQYDVWVVEPDPARIEVLVRLMRRRWTNRQSRGH